MDEIRIENSGENFLHSIIRAIKKFWVLIIAIVIASIAVGGAVIATKTPLYTAPETVVYKAQNIHSDSTVNNINAMNAFLDTIIDFCDEEIVVDRANYYYTMYLNEKAKVGSEYMVEDYIDSVKQKEDDYNYEPVKTQRIFSSNIGVTASKTDDEGSKFSFVISYTDLDREAARDKVKILILAVDMESRKTDTIDNETQNRYFAGINSELLDYGTGRITSNVSVPKILAISAILGLIAAFAVVYLISILDNTVKTKEELKETTGVDVFAFILQRGGK